MKTCWGITSGQAGMAAQVQALAAALKLTPVMKKILLRKPFAYLPVSWYTTPLRHIVVPYLIWHGNFVNPFRAKLLSAIDPDYLNRLTEASDLLDPPWPDVIICCGRRAAIAAIGLKAKALRTKFIFIGDPYINPSHFDIVVAMQHDKITGPNVTKTNFALHTITPLLLEQARKKFEPVFAGFPAPRVAVLLGGSTNKYILGRKAMQKVIQSLQRFQNNTRASLLMTPSRRTGEDNIALLREAFRGDKRASIYDFTGENPYLGLLALADAIIVSNDSVTMMSEACATGKPVYIVSLPGHENTKPARFARQLIESGIARELGNILEQWEYPVSHEMEALAQEIQEKFWGG